MALPMIDPNTFIQLSDKVGQIINFPTTQEALNNINFITNPYTLESFLNALYISFSEDLTGGTKQGAVVVSSEKIEDAIASTVEGTLSYVTPVDATGSILNALGLNVDFSKGALQTAVHRALTELGIQDPTWEDLKNGLYKIPVVLRNGVTYIDNNFVTPLVNKLYDLGLFSKGEAETFLFEPYTTYNFNSGILPGSYLNLLLKGFDRSSRKDYACRDSIEYAVSHADVINGLILQEIPNAIGSSAYLTFSTQDTRYCYFRCFIFTRDNISSYYVNIGSSFRSRPYIQVTNAYQCEFIFNVDEEIINFSSTGRPTLYPNSINFPVFQSWNAQNASDVALGGGIYGCGLNAILQPSIEGVTQQENSTIPSSNNIDISQLYPNWWNNKLTTNALDTTGALRPINWLPTQLTIGNIAGDDIFQVSQNVAQDGANVQDNISDLTDNANNLLPSYENGNGESLNDTFKEEDKIPSDTGTSVIVPPLPSASGQGGLYTVYNPTNLEINRVGAFLWSNEGIASILNIFKNNPLDAVISLKMLYATPIISENKETIVFGNAVSDTQSYLVTQRYISINCGTVDVAEVFGNATDYEPYTKCELFLPFIGFCDISSNDAVGGRMNVTYKIDTFTGSCVAIVSITKYGKSPTLYTFEGNCSVDIPLTGNNASIIAANTVRSALGGIALTGNIGGAVVGAGLGMLQPPTVSRSGSFSSNAGAMTVKKPYLVLTRHIPYDASEYNKLYGYPSNKLVKLSTLSGFTRVKDVHVEGITCTENEKVLIENALKDGVFL